MTMCVALPRGYEPERRYIAEVIFREFLGIEHRVVHGHHGDVSITLDGEAGELRLPDGLFATPQSAWLTPQTVPRRVDWLSIPDELRWSGGPTTVPAIFGAAHAAIYERRTDSTYLHIDVLGAAFFMLSRYEEVAAPAGDHHGRYPARASLAGRGGFLARPVVNELVELLWRALQKLWPHLVRRKRRFHAMLTHDIDRLFAIHRQPMVQVLRHLGGDLLVRGDAGEAVRRLDAIVRVRKDGMSADPFNTFGAIMDRSEALNLRSAFYFIPGKSAGGIDGNYSIEAPEVVTLMRSIQERGHEIGIHPSYDSYTSLETLKEEFHKLRVSAEAAGVHQTTWGGRQHYLRWKAPITWRLWDTVGLDYDSTVGYAEEAGFRTGSCYEFPAFDLVARRKLRLRERPLLLMDVTLTSAAYMGLDQERAAGVAIEIMHQCRLYSGDLTLLWHNSNLYFRSDRELYQRITDGLRDHVE